MDVAIAGVSDLYGWQFDLNFNPGVVSAGAASEGQFLQSGGETFFIAGTNDNLGGSVTNNANTLLTAVSGVSGGGVLESFDFRATAPGSSNFTLANLTLLNSDLDSIDAVVSGTSVEVTGNGGSGGSGGTGVPEPSVVTLLILGLLACVTRTRRGRLTPSASG